MVTSEALTQGGELIILNGREFGPVGSERIQLVKYVFATAALELGAVL